MMRNGVVKLSIKIIILLIPLWFLAGIYFKQDPFRVLYSYNNYYLDDNYSIPLNRDFVSTEVFLRNYPKYNYDSFIFGSSKSLAFLCSDWNGYISGIPFHFDSNGESLPGILTKIEYLDKHGVKINNCLIVLDSSIFKATENLEGHQYIQHPVVSGESELSFHFDFLTTFLTNRFFIPYLSLLYNFKLPAFFEYDPITEPRKFTYDSVNNDTRFTSLENEITSEGSKYYEKYSSLFYPRDTILVQDSENLIGDLAIEQLNRIAAVLEKNKADFRIILYPLYNQRKVSVNNLKTLNSIFGESNVHDFSGVNEITQNIQNYYETEHCRPTAGRIILENIYK